MRNLPHQYAIEAVAEPEGNVAVTASGKPLLQVASPMEFDGPGDVWSPEELLVTSLANCLILSFRAVAKASGFANWQSMFCKAEGKLDKVERGMAFTGFTLDVTLVIGSEAERDKAEKLVHKAEQICFVRNSLRAETELDLTIEVEA